ncbi:MAG: CdaR family protein [Deinococcales bacterium]
MSFLKRVATLASHNWPQKLGAVLLAFVIWLLVTNSSVTTTQRSLLVPLTVEGVKQSQVAVGVPQVVEVNVDGPSSRVDRLRPDSISATLDLSGLSGEFQQPISVQPPRGIHLVSVSPADVIGFLETVGNRDVGLTVALSGAPPGNELLSVSTDPATVTLTGQDQLLQKVARVMVVAPAKEGRFAAHPFAVDDAGVPVANVKIAPTTVTVQVGARSALVTKTVPIELTPPKATNLEQTTLSQPDVTLAGPPDTLAGIDSVKATVQPPTGPVDAGRYTVPVELDLPEGVAALSTPTAVLRYGRPSSNP